MGRKEHDCWAPKVEVTVGGKCHKVHRQRVDPRNYLVASEKAEKHQEDFYNNGKMKSLSNSVQHGEEESDQE